MAIELHRDEIHVDGSLSISVQRTQRLEHAIDTSGPSSLGLLPLHRVAEHPTLPARVRRRGGFFVPLGREESMWLGFNAARPHAIRVGLGRVDAVSGGAWRRALSGRPPNYVVSPPPRSVFGLRQADGSIHQFQFSESPLGLVVFPLKRGVPEPPAPSDWSGPENDQSRFGPVVWDIARSQTVTISMVDPQDYHTATGRRLRPPPGPSERYVPRLLP